MARQAHLRRSDRADGAQMEDRKSSEVTWLDSFEQVLSHLHHRTERSSQIADLMILLLQNLLALDDRIVHWTHVLNLSYCYWSERQSDLSMGLGINKSATLGVIKDDARTGS